MPTRADQSATFVLCIEPNAIRGQALLLCESIRQFGGRHRTARIVAVAPRADMGVDSRTRDLLAQLEVDYIEAPLNQVCREYASANRVYAAAWAEAHTDTDWIVVLDSDTIFVDEPELPGAADAGVRPVDQKGSTTTGQDDPFDQYWQALAALKGVPIDVLPWIWPTDRSSRIRASYNGGLVIARREARVLSAWADLFTRSVDAGLRPRKGTGLNVHASTGFVGTAASEYWGSNQAALAIALWSTTPRVEILSDAYNIPLHLLLEQPSLIAGRSQAPLMHVHYHWLFTAPYVTRALDLLTTLGLAHDRLDWLKARLPLA